MLWWISRWGMRNWVHGWVCKPMFRTRNLHERWHMRMSCKIALFSLLHIFLIARMYWEKFWNEAKVRRRHGAPAIVV
jgi:hypothetical protein